MAFLVTNLVQNILTELGQVEPNFIFDAIGGGATSIVAGTASSGFGLLANPPEDTALIGKLAIVTRDAGGAGASPEGKWGVVSNYVDSTWTMTIPTVTDAIVAGDTIMLAKQDKYPISQILFSINQGLQSLGDVPANADTSLTTSAETTEYDIPVGVKRGLKQVWYDDGSEWIQVTDRRNELTAGGTASRLHMPSTIAGYSVRLVYDGVHPTVTSYSSIINEYIHPKVATTASILKLLEWYNRQDANQDVQSYTLWLEGQYREKYLPMALTENPIQKSEKTSRFFNTGRGNPRYSRYGPRLAE